MKNTTDMTVGSPTRHLILKREDIVFVPDLAIKVLRLGIPLSLQFGLIAISSMAVQRIVNEYGKTVVAAFTATNRIEQLIHQPFTTLSASISTLYLVLSTWSGAF